MKHIIVITISAIFATLVVGFDFGSSSGAMFQLTRIIPFFFEWPTFLGLLLNFGGGHGVSVIGYWLGMICQFLLLGYAILASIVLVRRHRTKRAGSKD